MATDKYKCPRCTEDPRPANFGSPRNCAFTADGTFTPDNWRCGALDALMLAAVKLEVDTRFNDESLQVYPASARWHDDEDGADEWVEDWRGFIVITRYKQRGCASNAVHVGDFFPSEPVTLDLVERTIVALSAMRE